MVCMDSVGEMACAFNFVLRVVLSLRDILVRFSTPSGVSLNFFGPVF